MPRKYTMNRRSKNSEEVRSRIVRAAAELHVEKGILATSIQDIAERADVAPNTVYRYFPTYNDAVRACGVHLFQMVPPPTDESISGKTVDERVRSLVQAWFSFYEMAALAIETGQRAIVMPAVAEQFAEIEAARKRQVQLALGETVGAQHAVLNALTTFASWRSFGDSGLSAEQAVAIVISTFEKSRASGSSIPAA